MSGCLAASADVTQAFLGAWVLLALWVGLTT